MFLPRDEDHEFFERELSGFIPDRIFDAHCHLWQKEHLEAPPIIRNLAEYPREVGAREYRQFAECLHPGRRVGALFIPLTFSRPLLAAANEWVSLQAAQDPGSRGLFFVAPTDDPEWVRGEVKRLGLVGLKCYHVFSSKAPTWEAEIPDYLPERMVKVADEEGWVITLHLVKSRSVADPSNLHWLRHYCKAYPNMKLILAHSARGFQPAHNLEGLPQLRGLHNLYFDSSANCESLAHESILRFFGPKRLLYGSDFHICLLRGRSVAAGDSFLWLYEETPVWGEKHIQTRPVFVGLEHLRALKWACWSARLTDSEVEDIFWNNAAELFGL